MNYDMERMRKDLLDYFGTAMMSGFSMAMVDVLTIERSSDAELLKIAERTGMDIRRYRL